MAWINGQWVEDKRWTDIFNPGSLNPSTGYDKGPGSLEPTQPVTSTGYPGGFSPGYWQDGVWHPSGKEIATDHFLGPLKDILGTEGVQPDDPYSGMGDSPGPGGGMQSSMLSPAPQPRFAAGYTGDTSLDVIRGQTPPTWIQGPPFMPGPQPPFGDRPGMPNLPPQMNPPGYSRGPQMQPPFGGGLGGIDPWQPVQTPEWQQFPQPPQLPPSPPQMYPPMDIPRLRPEPGMQPPRPPVMQPPQVTPLPPEWARPMPPTPPGDVIHGPIPPPPPSIGDVWEPMPPPRPPVLPPDIIYDPPPVVLPRTDHEFNVAQREKTKARLAQDRAKTKKHYATLRAKGASKQTIAKAKAKSKARSKKIKAQHPKRTTRVIIN